MKDIKWLRELPVHGKFTIIIALMLLILLFGLINFWFSLKIMSGVRAYVGGEGLWSKSQKAAVTSLIKYTNSYNESDYDNFLNFLEVPLGDKQARLEMNKDDPDLHVVRQGFINGGNSPDDVNDLIFLYRWFRDISYMKTAIGDWTNGDAEIENLMKTGEKIYGVMSSGNYQRNPEKVIALEPLIQEVYATDMRLTVLENHFSATLGEASRWIRSVLFLVTLALTILLGSIALLVAFYIGKVIEEVDRVKSEFVSMASHELRTPMAAIKGFVAMILNDRYGKISPQLRRPLENISLSMERLIRLSSDLLDAARLESRAMKPKIVECDSQMIIKEVANSMTDLALRKDIKIEILELDSASVRADPGYVRQILNNLIGNAIKFTPKGKISITSKSLGAMQLIYVADTGIGIARSDQLKIFQKFQQLTSETGHRPMGSGLGLFISHELALKMKGNLALEKSSSGTGSTFVLSLPLSKLNV